RGVRQGVQQGLQQGVRQGVQQGLQQGELTLLRRQIEKRFGAVPAWAEERLSSRPPADLEALGVRLLDAKSLEDLLA
nr:DUF4351 domain-containing protein [Acidobacteriota bacterium]